MGTYISLTVGSTKKVEVEKELNHIIWCGFYNSSNNNLLLQLSKINFPRGNINFLALVAMLNK